MASLFGPPSSYYAPVHRYKEKYRFLTHLDQIADLMVLVESLTSKAFLIEVLRDRHGLSPASAKDRSKAIAAHIRLALQYVRQCDVRPSGVDFLPLYYAFLNLAKCYILLSPRWNDLRSQRFHGASYDTTKSSQSLFTEVVKLQPKGAIPLFYEAVTGSPTPGIVPLAMRDVYPYIGDVGTELSVTTGSASGLALLDFETPSEASVKRLVAKVYTERPAIPRGALQLFRPGYRRMPSKGKEIFSLRSPDLRDDQTFPLAVRSTIRPFLLHHGEDHYGTPISGGRLLLFEELPILLAFFHMSSVVRYNPEFLERLRDSRHWPMLAAAQRHSLRKFLLLFWSFMVQKSVHIATR